MALSFFFHYCQYLARMQPGCVTGNTFFEIIEANTGKRAVLLLPSCHNVDPMGLVWFCLCSNQTEASLVIL